jgi:hypothetical protein
MFARATAILLLALLAPAALPNDSLTYRFPLNTDEVMLAGTFGELRPDHFHSGIDIKTGGLSGQPVYAVADGYVYRIKISPVGYGKAIFIRHTNGYFSVYAHLDQFSGEIDDFVYQRQFVSRRWEQDIYLSSDRIRVRQGQLIALSGNTGNSHGPHLHFELRNEADEPINPLPHYPRYITDHIPPILQNVAFEPLTPKARINGSLSKVEWTPSGGNGEYFLADPVEITDKVGLEYRGFDVLDAAPNHCGINHARLYLDNELRFEFDLSHFTFDEKKYINVHTDYGHNRRTSRLYERAWLADGNDLASYPLVKEKGAIWFEDYELHTVRLELADEFGNTTRFTARVRRQAVSSALPTSLPGGNSRVSVRQRDGALVAEVDQPATAHLNGLELLFPDGEKVMLPPATYEAGKLLFLYPLQLNRFPEHLRDPVTGTRVPLHIRKAILPQENNLAEFGEVQVYFPFGSAFDTLHLSIRQMPGNGSTFSDLYEVGDADVPLLTPFLINFTPSRKGNPAHTVIARKGADGEWRFVGKEHRDDGTLYASASEMGVFAVMADSTPPLLRPINFFDGGTVAGQQGVLQLEVRDNFSGINGEKILLSLDGAWALGEYDRKSATLSHTLRRRPGPGQHLLEVMVYDNAGNMSRNTYLLNF